MIKQQYKELGDFWFDLLNELITNGNIVFDEDEKLLELLNVQTSIENVSKDKIIDAFADKDRIKLLLHKYKTPGFIYKGRDYGSRLYNSNGVNQIEKTIERLNMKPETKSATLGMHIPGEKLLTCLSLLDFKIRVNKETMKDELNMTAVYRSQDVFNSQHGNLLALRQIQEKVAVGVNKKVGNLNLYICSAHIYEKDFEKIKEIQNVLSVDQ